MGVGGTQIQSQSWLQMESEVTLGYLRLDLKTEHFSELSRYSPHPKQHPAYHPSFSRCTYYVNYTLVSKFCLLFFLFFSHPSLPAFEAGLKLSLGKDDTELLIFLYPPPKCWDDSCIPSCQVYVLLGIEPKALCVLQKHPAN